MSLLRKWALLDVLMPALAGRRRPGRVVAWNLGDIDDALAVTLAHFHHASARAGELVMFHGGIPPARRPVQWARADLRGVPKRPWLEPVDGRPSRWTPHRRLLESVLLASPPRPVDLLISGPPAGRPGGPAGPLDAVRRGGHLLLSEPPQHGALPGRDWAVVDPACHLYRRLTPPTSGPPPEASDGTPALSLARHHERAVLVDSYASLARSIAHRFSHRGERMEDLEQVAMLALVRASDRYDPERGHSFGPFAATCITGELKRHFRDKMWAVRVPRSLQETYLAVRAARDELTQANGTSPTIGQIAGHLHITEEAVLTSMEAATNSWATSLDAPAPDADGSSVDIPVTDPGLDLSLEREVLREAIGGLSPTEQLIVKRLFFDGWTQRQVAEEIHVSQMHISRLRAKTLAKMRRMFEPA